MSAVLEVMGLGETKREDTNKRRLITESLTRRSLTLLLEVGLLRLVLALHCYKECYKELDV